MIRLTAKQKRERALLTKLEAEHGYMFFQFPIKKDRYTTQVHRRRGSRKLTLTPAFKAVVAAPMTSLLSTSMERAARREAARKRTR